MSRPRLGITCDLTLREFPEAPHQRGRHVLMDAYVEAVLKAGGLPVLLPTVEDEQDALAYLETLDGLIISGGGHDIDPEAYGEAREAVCGPPNPRRGRFEVVICAGALDCDMPVLGICGGIQVLNVAAGGSLHQDIAAHFDDPLPHTPGGDDATYTFHPVEVLPSALEGIIGQGPHQVNSHHHQSVKELGTGLRLAAQSPDGVVEAIESIAHRFVLGVQWHPESMSAYGYGDSLCADHLFARLADEAREYAMEAGPRGGEMR